MSTQDPGRTPAVPALAALPRLADIPTRTDGGYDPDRVREAFEAFQRHTTQLQSQLRVLRAAGQSARVEPTGHAVRMDALHLIRAAAEFADTVERDAQQASAAQLARTEEEVRGRQRELQERKKDVERYRQESERQRAEIITATKNEARELLASANRDATQELREAEARAARLLEQARHQATELTNSARAEVEQTLEWARRQAGVIFGRAQQGAEQLLRAAGLGEPALSEVVEAILRSAEPVPESGSAVVSREREQERRPEPTQPPAPTARSTAPPPASASPAGTQGEGRPAPPPPSPAPPAARSDEPASQSSAAEEDGRDDEPQQ